MASMASITLLGDQLHFKGLFMPAAIMGYRVIDKQER